MEYLDVSVMSEEQLWICRQRVEGKTYSAICNDFKRVFANKRTIINKNLSNDNISTCLFRSGLGYRWEKTMGGGPEHYLCDEDLNTLKAIVDENSEYNQMDADEIIIEAIRLKGERQKKALLFFKKIKCHELANKLSVSVVDTPVRSWVNGILVQLQAVLKNRRFIDPKRLEACHESVIRSFFTKFSNIFMNAIPCLTFTVDETMLSPNSKSKKAVVNERIQAVIDSDIPDIPHFTAMCAVNYFGNSPPPMIILKGLVRIPPELIPITAQGLVIIASSPSGWETRDTFLYWSICFINWLSTFRETLDPAIKNGKAVVILDGHNSRENPMALVLLMARNIDVIVIPAHTSHILQVFDVSISSPLKSYFSEELRKMLKEIDENQPTAPQLRRAIIMSFIKSWSSAASSRNAINGFRKTGILPCDVNAPLSNYFVRELTEDEQQRFDDRTRRNATRLNINNTIITRPEIISRIDNSLIGVEKFQHLRLQAAIVDYVQYVRSVIISPHNGCYLLSRPPPYVRNGTIVTFN